MLNELPGEPLKSREKIYEDGVEVDKTSDYVEGAAVEENLKDLSISNSQYRPFRDQDTAPCHYDTVSVASSRVPPNEIKKRVKQTFAKQQKQRSQRRVKRGEASLVNKKRRELAEVVTSSKDLFF